MAQNVDSTSKKIADSSGFPLQIKIRNLVSNHAKWDVFLEEHPWSSSDGSTSGYIDLIIKHSGHHNDLILIEVKRVRDSQWVFLAESINSEQQVISHIWLSDFNKQNKKWADYGWKEASITPKSYLSSFCAILGQEQGRNVLLDRTTSMLAESVEAYANQEMVRFDKEYRGQPPMVGHYARRYTPVIVTNADLRLATFDPEKISLRDGTLPADTTYETIPFVRYRRSMGTLDIFAGRDIYDASRNSEKTIIIINSLHLDTFLQKWDFINLGPVANFQV